MSTQQLENNVSQTQSPLKVPATRRRNQRSHQAILNAAAELLEEKGYGGVCIEAIANRAGVGKQTIYRWWSSKAEVMMEAYSADAAHNFPTPDTGSVKQDLCQISATNVYSADNDDGGCCFHRTNCGSANGPQFSSCVSRTVYCQSQKSYPYHFRGGVSTEVEIRPDLNLELVIDGIYGPIWYRLLLKHAPLDDVFAEELMNLLMLGIQS